MICFIPRWTETKSELASLFFSWENIRKLFNHLKTAFKLLIFISRRKFDLFSFKPLNWLPIFYCCSIVVAPHLNECWLAGHTCSDGHITIFLWPAQRSWMVIMFLPCPSGIRPGGQKQKYGLKTRFRAFWACFGCFVEISTFRQSVHPFGQWMGYGLCRELVLGFWGSEPETNLKWLNMYWSCAPPIVDVRLDRRSVWEGSELGLFYM